MRGLASVLAIAVVLAVPAPVPGAEAGEDAGREIAALIEAVGASGCRFQRNGRWHPSTAAQSHLQRKLATARRRGLDGDAETFIDSIASRSSTSGQPYRVQCADAPEQPAADWFRAQLQRLRASDSSQTRR